MIYWSPEKYLNFLMVERNYLQNKSAFKESPSVQYTSILFIQYSIDLKTNIMVLITMYKCYQHVQDPDVSAILLTTHPLKKGENFTIA